MIESVAFKYRFELLLPTADNEGKPFPQAKFRAVEEALLERFDAYRSQPTAPFVGAWRDKGNVYHDKAILFIVDAPRSDESLFWFRAYKRRLQKNFRQIEIYLAVTEVLWL